ncbi:hypothetical protein HYS54_01300, partial [Candidatus Micrarchaeota archaeon]|nr:hypothetical protein [Candidatus Micrarchaeota archaeon]
MLLRLTRASLCMLALLAVAHAAMIQDGMDNPGPWGITQPNGNALARDASGCHATYTSAGKLVYATSQNCSEPFNKTTLLNASRIGATLPSILLDANGALTVVYVENKSAVAAFRKPDNASDWSYSLALQQESGTLVTSLSAAADADGWVHAAYSYERNDTSAFLGFSVFLNGSWKSWNKTSIERATRQGSEEYLNAALCLGADNSRHLFYVNGTSDAAYANASSSDAAWSMQGNRFKLSAQSNIESRLSCAVDSDGRVHVVESDLTATDYVRYRNSTANFSKTILLDSRASMGSVLV